MKKSVTIGCEGDQGAACCAGLLNDVLHEGLRLRHRLWTVCPVI